MARTTSHPDRNDLVEAIRTSSHAYDDHLKRCDRCRAVYELLLWSGAGLGQLVWEPAPEQLMRHKAIPRLVESRRPRRAVRGRMIFDSWHDLPSLAVRQAPFGVERRIRFAASHYVLEFVASRQLDGWDFVARVYDGDNMTRQFILRVGRNKLHVGAGNCYFWTSKRPPRRLSLLSTELQIDLGALQW